MVIAMVFIAFALVSVICAFCSSANKNNNEDNSTQIVREDLNAYERANIKLLKSLE